MENNKQENLKWLNNPILIGGHEKAGTNLVISLLDSHQQLCVFSAGHLHSFKNNMTSTSIFSKGEEKIDFLINSDTPLTNLGKGLIRGTKNTIIPKGSYDLSLFKKHAMEFIGEKNDYKTCLQAIFYAHAKILNQDLSKIKAFSESTPGNEYTSDILFSFFPKAKFIHIIRNPLDNWSSWQKAGENRKKRVIYDFILSWNKSVITGLNNLKKFGNSRYTIISYENLVSNPKKVMKNVANFTNINFDERMLSPTKHNIKWTGNSMHKDVMQNISSSSVNNYKNNISEHEKNIIEYYCFDLFELLNEKLNIKNITLNKKNIILSEIIEILKKKKNNITTLNYLTSLLKCKVYNHKKDKQYFL